MNGFTRSRLRVKPFIYEMELTAADIPGRMAQAFDFTFEYCMGVIDYDGQPPRLFLEEPVMGRGGPGATIPQAFVDGAIMAGAYQAGAVLSLINNSSWKKKVCGNGNANKLVVSEWVEENWPVLYTKAVPMTLSAAKSAGYPDLEGRGDQDVLDAGCINLHGWKYVKMIEKIMRRRDG